MDKEDQILALFEKLNELKSEQDYMWAKVVKEAKQYAMMKSFGRYLETSHGMEIFIVVPLADRQGYMDMFTRNMLEAATDALARNSVGI